jgi:hypothetical protein
MPGSVEELHSFTLNRYNACRCFTVVLVAATGSAVLDRSEVFVKDKPRAYE